MFEYRQTSQVTWYRAVRFFTGVKSCYAVSGIYMKKLLHSSKYREQELRPIQEKATKVLNRAKNERGSQEDRKS